jgi:hypothetical protein
VLGRIVRAAVADPVAFSEGAVEEDEVRVVLAQGLQQARGARCRTASTSSNGTTAINSPRCLGTNRPAATVTVQVIVVSADGRTQRRGDGAPSGQAVLADYLYQRAPLLCAENPSTPLRDPRKR